MAETRVYGGYTYERQADGTWRRAASAQAQMPADPTFPYQGAQAAAQAANTGADATVNQATIDAQIRAAQAEAIAKERAAQTAGLGEGQRWGADGQTAVPIPGYTRQGLSPEVRSAALQAYNDAVAIDNIVADLRRKFKAGPGQTSGLAGVRDFLPLDENKLFDDAGQRARGYVKRSLGFTGGEGNTVAESSALYDPYLPDSWDRDAQVGSKLDALSALGAQARAKAAATLGGVPDANGVVTPQPNALTATRLIPGQSAQPAPFGATQGATEAYPPEFIAEHDAMVAQLMQQGGRLDPAAYAQAKAQLARKYGYEPGDPAADQAWVNDINGYLESGGRTVPGGVQPAERDLSLEETINNSLVSNPIGAGAAGFADMGGFGGVSALLPQQMQALGNEYPVSMALGQIGGAIGGTSALGKLGKETLGRGLPMLMGGGKGAQFGRNLAGDAAFSGIYGGVTEADPLGGAALGAIGSGGGQAIGKGLGRVVGGLDVSPAVQRLKALGIPMTVPQQLGGFVKSVEEKANSLPLIGDMIRARHQEGITALNRQAFAEGGSPIGATVQNIGEEGVQELTDQIGDAYTNATSGVSGVPFDNQFITDMQAVEALAQALPDDYRPLFAKVLQNRVAPLTDGGQMDGYQFQQAMRGLKNKRAGAGQATPGFEDEYRDALTGTMNALEGQMMRGGGQDVVEGLSLANTANRNKGTLQQAVRGAAGGSQSGMPFVFTPNQLQRAGQATEKKYPGPRPFAQLADDGQAVLANRVPDSGTAGRAAQMLLPSGLLGAGAGLGFAAGGDTQGAATGTGLSALTAAALLLGGTKTGQKALQRALIDRGGRAQIIGRAIRNRSGLLGAASLPLMLEAGL